MTTHELAASLERRGSFADLCEHLPTESVVFADARVLVLHPSVKRVLRARRVIALRAGEALKSVQTLERLAASVHDVSRRATFVALGGGTVGDLITVLAHLHKRGVRLIQVPTTMLAAVDSSIGGKGALNVRGVKNALGVFHAADETWLCPAFFETLTERQRCEGRLEAWKMVVTLDAAAFRRWSRSAPDDAVLLREARALKEAVVRVDPFEQRGLRAVLNFGHTFGHVFESLSRYSVRHGEAVGLGMLCALDVGVAMGLTPRAVAVAVEAALPNPPAARRRIAQWARSSASTVERLLRADKKGTAAVLQMVLLEAPGRWQLVEVAPATWRAAWLRWRRG